MVAIISANGLGLERSSANILGDRGLLGSASLGRAGNGVYVNSANGNLVIQNTDEILVGRGPDAIVNRTYNSLGAYAGDTDNWLTNGQRKIVLTGTANAAGSTAALTDWDGTVIVFSFVSAAVGYRAADKPYRDDALTLAGSVWTWTDGKSRMVQKFDNSIGGRIVSAEDADANIVTYTYDAATTAGKLTRVTTANSSTGQTNYTSLVYTGANLTSLVTSYYDLASATNKTLTRTLYTYDAQNRLSTVRVDLSPGDNAVADGKVYTTTYTYVGTSGAAAKQVASITQSDGTSLTITYDASGRVATLTQLAAAGVNRTTTFTYNAGYTRVTDPLGQAWDLHYDAQGRLWKLVEPPAGAGANNRITEYFYDPDAANKDDVLSVKVFDGTTLIAAEYNNYDANGNLTVRQDMAGNTTKWTYGSKNEVLTMTSYTGIDPDGLDVDGNATDSKPGQPTGAMTTRYAYDAENHLRFAVTQEGRVTEMRYDAAGNLITTIAWTGTLYPTGGLGETTSISEATLASWVSATVDKSQAERTDTVYDYRGNITTVTRYSKTDSAGNGLTTEDWSRVTHVYDQFGKLLSRVNSGTNVLGGEPALATESFVYDGMGRVISSTDIYGVATTVSIVDSTRVTTITTPNDITRTSTYNIAGELVSDAIGGSGVTTGTTSYAYDALGRLRVKTDPVGVKTYYVYDAQNRLTGEIDGDGSLTEYRYNVRNQIVATVRYATAVSAANITTLNTATTNTVIATIRPTANAADRWAWSIYDTGGRLTGTIDAAGAIQKFTYDGAGRLTNTLRYNALIDSALIESYKVTLPASLPLPAANDDYDRATRNIYDLDGLLIATVDEEGYLAEHFYDAAARRVKTVRYAVSSANHLVSSQQPAYWRTATLAQLKTQAASNPGADIHAYWLYDGRGRIGATIDGEGNVTRFHYTARGDVDQEIRGQKVTASTAYTLATLPAATGTLETTRYTRNAAGQVLTRVRTLSGGTETTAYSYDTRGRLTAETTAETVSTETRTTRYRYDVKGRLIGEVGGVGSATLSATPTDAQLSAAIDVYGIRYAYDTADRLIHRIDPDGSGATGRKTLFYYDGDGQLRFEINALGEVTEYRFSVLEDRTEQIVYGTRIAAGTLATLTGGLVTSAVTNAVAAIASSTLDSKVQWAYTTRGLLSTEYNPLYVGSPTANNYRTFSYDAFGQPSGVNTPTGTAAYNLDQQTIGFYRRGLQYWDYHYLNGSGQGSTQQTWGYDAFGRVGAHYTNNTDWRRHTYNYDRSNRLTLEYDNAGNYKQFSYDARSNLISSRDFAGKVTTYAYDLFNRNVTTTTAEGIVTQVRKNAYGQTIQLIDGAGRTTSYTYDKNGNLKTVTDAAGTTTNTYDNADRLIETTDARGVKTRYTYDAANRVLTRVQDYGSGTLNLTTTTVYDAKGQAISVTDPAGVVTTYSYDLKGQRTRVVQDAGAGRLNITTDFAYRPDGKVIWQTDAVGTAAERKTFFEYDTLGRLTRKTEDQGTGKLNLVTNFAYDVNNNLTAISDNLARVTRLVYDLENRLVATINAEGEVTQNGYDAEGRVIWTRQHLNKAATGSLSGFAALQSGSEWLTATTSGSSVLLERRTKNQSTGAITVLGSVTVAWSGEDRIARTLYDGDGRATYVVDPEGFVTKHQYDGAGNIIKTWRYAAAVSVDNSATKATLDGLVPGGDPADAAIARYTFDGANRLTDVIDPAGTTTHYWHDAAGNITQIAYAWGTADEAVTQRGFDNLGRMTWETRAAGTADATTTTYAYDALGRMTAQTNASGTAEASTTAFGYDALGREIWVRTASGTAEAATTYSEYDARGNRVKVTDPRGNIGYFYYDGANRQVLQVDPEGFVTETAYQIGSSVSSIKRYYQRATNLASISVTVRPTMAGHALDATTSFSYDLVGRVKTTTDAQGFTESYGYDALGNRTSIVNKLGGTTTLTYDKRGLLRYEYVNAAAHTDTGALQAGGYYKTIYEYDSRGNLVHQVDAYGLSERRDTWFSYDKLDRLISRTDPVYHGVTPVTTFQYDRRGNLILMTAPNGGRTYSFYDDNNRKIAEISPVNTLTSWSYDDNGNVVSQKVHSSAVAFPTTPGGAPPSTGSFRETQFSYDRSNRTTQSRVLNVRTGRFDGANFTTVANTTLVSNNLYDAAGNLIREQDANGNFIHHYYDKNGREIARLDQGNYLTSWTRDAEGNVLSETRFANVFTGTPVAGGTPPTVTPSGNDRTTTFTYDRMGRRLTETRTGVVAYTANGNALAGSGSNATVSYSYNGLGLATSKTEANGDRTDFAYDIHGRLTKQSDATALDFNAGGTASVRHVTYFYYDGNNNLVRTEERAEAPGGGYASGYSAADDRITRFGYDGGKLRWVLDPTGFYRHLWYDSMGQITHDYFTRQRSDGTNTAEYEGNLTSYDLAGRVVSQWYATYSSAIGWTTQGPVTSYAYTVFGEIASRALDGAVQERYEYDNAGRVVKTTAGDGVSKFFAHDANGNVTLSLVNNGVYDIAHYTQADAVASVTGTYGDITIAAGALNQGVFNATITTYEKRNLANATYEPNRTIASATASVTTTQTLIRSRTYTAFGEVASETDARGNVTDYAYNTLGKLVQKVSPWVTVTGENGVDTSARPTEYYYYDLSGRMIGMHDANGNLTTRTLLAGTGHGGSEAKVLKEFRPDTSVWETRYDAFGDARQSIDGLGRMTQSTYDKAGRVTQVIKPSGFADYYAYDGLGQRIKHWNSVFSTPIYGEPVWIEDGYWEYDEYYGSYWVDTSYWYTPVIGYAPAVETTDYDIQGRVTSTKNFAGDVTSYAYSWNGSITNGGLALTGGWTKTTSFATGRTASETQDSFGRMLTRTDQGGRVYTYTYNRAGQLVNQVSTAGQNLSYTYFNTGRLATLLDNNGAAYGYTTSSTDATYTYDADGNRRYERYQSTVHYYDGYGGYYTSTITHQDATATWDGLNRMTGFTDSGASGNGAVTITNKYDANGNVRRTTATYNVFDYTGAITGTQTTSDYWYRYDGLNRFTTVKGVLVGGVITRGTGEGRDITYNLAGERATVSRTSYLPGSYDPYIGYLPGYAYETREIYTYNVDGYLLRMNMADGGYVEWDGYTGIPAVPGATGPGTQRAVYTLDAMGRTTNYTEYAADGTTVNFNRYSIVYDMRSNITSETNSTRKFESNGTNTYVSYQSTYYGAGGLVSSAYATNYRNGAYQSGASTTTNYAYWDGAVQSSITIANSPGGTFTSTFYYDQNGHLSSVSIQDGRPRTVSYVNDAQGQVLVRSESSAASGNPKQLYYYFNGLRVGANGNNGNDDPEFAQALNERTQGSSGNGAFRFGSTTATPYADFDQAYDPVNPQAPGNAAQSYVARDGDTLQSIASAIWGDASLWYMLAEANGLTASSVISAGQLLVIPNKVANVHNNSSTFRPYDPNKAIGDIQPTTPAPAKPKKGKCGVFGIILLAIIAVAVTVVTAGAAVAALSPTIGSIGAGISAIAAGTTGLAAGTLIGIGAASAALGSIVSQGIGVATGIQEKFSWKGVALAALGGAVSAGIGPEGLLGKGGLFGGADAAKGAIATVNNVALRAGLNAAAGNAITQGLGVAFHLQEKFDWVGVAAAGVGAGVGAWVGGEIGARPISQSHTLENIGKNLVTGAAGSVANAATRSLLEGSNFGDNVVATLPGAIGQTLGELVAKGVAGGIDKIVETRRLAAELRAAQARAPGASVIDEAARSGAAAPLSDAGNQERVFRGPCFVAGTLVHTARGLIAIEDIKVGDWVMARADDGRNPDLHRRKVTEKFFFTDKATVKIVFRALGKDDELVQATKEHPFHVDGKGWVAAGNLQVDDLVSLIDGALARVVEISDVEELADVHNFSVESDHTYFVGHTGLWVHNDYPDHGGDPVQTPDPPKKTFRNFNGDLVEYVSSERGEFVRTVERGVVIPRGLLPNDTDLVSQRSVTLNEYANGPAFVVMRGGVERYMSPGLFFGNAARNIAPTLQNGGTISADMVAEAQFAVRFGGGDTAVGNTTLGQIAGMTPGTSVPSPLAPLPSLPMPVPSLTIEPLEITIQPPPVNIAITGIAQGLDAGGRQIFTRNPLLVVEWYNFQSPVNNRTGFGTGLSDALRNGGVNTNLNYANTIAPGSLGRGQNGLSLGRINNINGAAGERFAIDIAQQRGFAFDPDLNTRAALTRNGGARVVDGFLTQRIGHPRNYVNLEIEAKVGEIVDGSSRGRTAVRQAGFDAQRLAENANLRRAGVVVDNIGRRLGPIGYALDGYAIYDAVQRDGGTFGVNAQRETSGVVGGIAGGAGGAWAGAAAGAAIGSVVPIVGTAAGAIIGGLVGGFLGGWGGDAAGRATYDAVR